jgi:hypothetical protein
VFLYRESTMGMGFFQYSRQFGDFRSKNQVLDHLERLAQDERMPALTRGNRLEFHSIDWERERCESLAWFKSGDCSGPSSSRWASYRGPGPARVPHVPVAGSPCAGLHSEPGDMTVALDGRRSGATPTL